MTLRVRRLALAAIAVALSAGVPEARASGAPRPLVLWAWDRPENLGFIEPRDTGVAFLAGTIFLDGTGLSLLPRTRELRIPPGTDLVAVVRLETGRSAPPVLSPDQRSACARGILEMSSWPRVSEVQVDFDALASERAFYRGLMADLRDMLPPGRRLSMTALASWCLGDPWIGGFPVDRAVPMLFRMGPEAESVRLHLRKGGDFGLEICRGDAGVSVDEPLPRLPPGRRAWVFNPLPWDRETVRRLSAGLEDEP